MARDKAMPPVGTIRPSRDRRRVGPRPPETAAAAPHHAVGATRFAQSLLRLSGPSIERLVARLKARRSSPDDDVAWWEATTALNRALRRRGIGQHAAMAAHLASQAMLAAAARTGLALTPDVLAAARSAGEVARLLVAGDANATGAGYLARDWEDVLIPPAAPSGPAGERGRQAPRATAQRPKTSVHG